jgi:integrase
MPRKSTGTVRILKNDLGQRQWYARWTREDGTRTPYVPLDPTIPLDAEATAKALAARLAPKVRKALPIDGASVTGETVREYAKRWCAWREGRGLGCVKDDRAALEKHVLPVIGALDVRAVGRDDLKRLVTELDAKARKGFSRTAAGRRSPFGWKTAVNAWSTVRALLRDARSAKDVTMCVRDDNPCDGVVGPDVGAKKAKTYLWPSEFSAFVTCSDVPLRWRRLVAIAVYVYARAGELAALEWSDVDLEHATIHIHRSLDVKRGRGIKATKSEAARRVPIEPELLPFLLALHREAGGKGPVVRLPSEHLSRALRLYLKRAGIDRTDLHTGDATRKAITFHDLRATGVTWCAVRGDDALKIMQRAGHADFETTKVYLREAENLAAGFGTPFPPLPDELLTNRPGIAPGDTREGKSSKLLRKKVEAPGIEPGSENGLLAHLRT